MVIRRLRCRDVMCPLAVSSNDTARRAGWLVPDGPGWTVTGDIETRDGPALDWVRVASSTGMRPFSGFRQGPCRRDGRTRSPVRHRYPEVGENTDRGCGRAIETRP